MKRRRVGWKIRFNSRAKPASAAGVQTGMKALCQQKRHSASNGTVLRARHPVLDEDAVCLLWIEQNHDAAL